MLILKRQLWAAVYLIILLSLFSGVYAQKKKAVKSVPAGNAAMWEKVDVGQRDLFAGPGGTAMVPDLSTIKFIKEEKAGYNKKYRISDGSGRTWVAKLGREARAETAAVRLLWGLGYKTEINYLVPTITIPGKGTFQNVRLEARPDNIERLDGWRWKQNPFVGTKELQGLKMMMIFMTNWDAKDIQNKVLQVGNEKHYIVSDLGGTFGRLGNNNLPLFFRIGRKTGSPKHYIKTKFVSKVKNGEVILASKGSKNRNIFKGFTVADARWLSNLLNQLTDKQIRDTFRAANFSPADVETYVRAVKTKVGELDRAAGEPNLAVTGQ
ncbi:MAG: hypothetical protein H7070_06375 [Saprospiraceae bacterium]|nr:hypothetical protein [Pyrinomonadaceae bacterium]